RRLIREAFAQVRGTLTDFGLVHVNALLDLLDSGADFEYDLPGGVHVIKSGGTIGFSTGRLAEEPIVYSIEVPVPGIVSIPELDTSLETELSDVPLDPVRPKGSEEVVLDFDAVAGKLSIRNWQPGDRISPLGLGGTKKVQDIFVDAKIPRAVRDRVPLLLDQEKVLWVFGLAVSEQAKVSTSTRRWLKIRVSQVQKYE
ncbi:MAG TPA: tRNA lysidine(34) synthetase TilS, partial [Armatimonadota bacterium]